jgi:hypothetical protein
LHRRHPSEREEAQPLTNCGLVWWRSRVGASRAAGVANAAAGSEVSLMRPRSRSPAAPAFLRNLPPSHSQAHRPFDVVPHVSLRLRYALRTERPAGHDDRLGIPCTDGYSTGLNCRISIALRVTLGGDPGPSLRAQDVTGEDDETSYRCGCLGDDAVPARSEHGVERVLRTVHGHGQEGLRCGRRDVDPEPSDLHAAVAVAPRSNEGAGAVRRSSVTP